MNCVPFSKSRIPRAITSDAKKDVNDDTSNTKNNVLFVFEDVARSMRRGGRFVFFFFFFFFVQLPLRRAKRFCLLLFERK